MKKAFFEIHMRLLPVLVLMPLTADLSHAEARINTVFVASETWDLYVNRDGSGLFVDITRAIFEPAGIKVQIDYVPYKRALKNLEVQSSDAMYGTYSADKENKHYLVTPKNPIDTEKTVALCKKEAIDNWRHVSSRRNLELAWVRGYDYHDSLPGNIQNFVEVSDSNHGLRMLKANRIDCFLDHSIELAYSIDKANFDTSNFQFETAMENGIYMAFTKNSRGEKLAALFDQGYERILRSGKLEQIFQTYQLPYPF